MPEPDFERLNRLIKEAGAEWEAGRTSMSRFFGERPTTEHFGLSFDPVPASREAAALRLEEGSPRRPHLRLNSTGENRAATSSQLPKTRAHAAPA
jgi:hypothetical protein